MRIGMRLLLGYFRAKSLSQQRLILYPKDIISVSKSLHRLIFSH